jgi:hypothetical protein
VAITGPSQETSGSTGNVQNQFTVSLPGAPTQGHTLLLIVGTGTAPVLTGVTQAGTTWRLLYRFNNPGVATVDFWLADVAAAGVSATATVACSPSVVAYDWHLSEWDQISYVAAPHTSAGLALPGTTAAAAPAAVVTDAGAVVISVARNNASRTVTAGPTGGFTTRSGVATVLTVASRLPGATGTYATDWTLSGTATGLTATVSLLAATLPVPARVTQQTAEVLLAGTPNARVTQQVAEVLLTPNANAVLGSVGVEALTVPPAAARLGSVATEVLQSGATPPRVVGRATAHSAGVAVASISVPLTTTTGNLLVAAVASFGGVGATNNVVPPPAGWTTLRATFLAGGTNSNTCLSVFARPVAGAGAGPFVFTPTTSAGLTATVLELLVPPVVAAYPGVLTLRGSDPVTTTVATSVTLATGAPLTAPPSLVEPLVLAFLSGLSRNGTPGGGWSEEVDANGGTTGSWCSLYVEEAWGAGAVLPTVTWANAFTTNTHGQCAWTLAIPSVWPPVVTAGPEIVQLKVVSGQASPAGVTLDAPPTPGNLLVVFVERFGSGTLTFPSGWRLLGYFESFAVGATEVAVRPVPADSPQTYAGFLVSTSTLTFTLMEIAGVRTGPVPWYGFAVNTLGGTTTVTGPTTTVPPAAPRSLVLAYFRREAGAVTPGAGWTELADSIPTPHVGLGELQCRSVVSAGGYAATATYAGTTVNPNWGIGLAVAGADAAAAGDAAGLNRWRRGEPARFL